jgi:hypothetical protein
VGWAVKAGAFNSDLCMTFAFEDRTVLRDATSSFFSELFYDVVDT